MLHLEMLPADFGDCLWLEYGEPGTSRLILIDGGPGDTYQRALRPRLDRFIASRHPGTKPRIELLVVTHIDNDHIVGALDLVRDTGIDVDIGQVWFNGWSQIAPPDQLGVKEGIALADAIRERNLPHNEAFGGRAACIDENDVSKRHNFEGGLALTVLSPGSQQLQRLRQDWKKVVAKAGLGTEKPSDLLGTSFNVRKLADKPFKSDSAVANGSSIVLLAEYEGRRVLLAGDSFPRVVEDTLRKIGYSEKKRLTLGAYKMAHHGSRGNNSRTLLRIVDCSHFLFSTSGAHSNHPNEECVARVLCEARAPARLYSNYRRGDQMLWSHAAIRKEFKHRVIEPDNDGEGLTVEVRPT